MDCLFLRYRCLLLEYRQTLCAYAIMALIPGGNAHLLNICVRPDYRRIGFRYTYDAPFIRVGSRP